jgi:hypothetical protein
MNLLKWQIMVVCSSKSSFTFIYAVLRALSHSFMHVSVLSNCIKFVGPLQATNLFHYQTPFIS